MCWQQTINSRKRKTTINTLYDVASLTKVIVIIPIISKLIENKKININDKVKTYLKEFKYSDITIFHLLTHTSGLPASIKNKKIMKNEVILKKIYSIKKTYKTGTQVIYSDIGYILLGKIIENIYNKPLDIIAKKEIFIPLDMKNTCYKPKNKNACAPTEVTMERGVIKGIVHDKKAYFLNQVAGHAGIFTNIIDISNYLSMILNNGKYKNKRFLSKKIIDLWFKPIVYEKSNKRYRSLCWIVGKNNLVINEGKNVISFSGFTGPSISIDRKNKIAIALLTNRIHPNSDNILIYKKRKLITKKIYEIKIKKENLIKNKIK